MVAFDVTSSHAVECPLVVPFPVFSIHRYCHPVGVSRKEYFGLPFDFHIPCFLQHFVYGNICEMPLPGGGQGPVEGHMEIPCVRMVLQICLGGFLWPHSMAARRTFPYLVYFSDRFHLFQVLWKLHLPVPSFRRREFK